MSVHTICARLARRAGLAVVLGATLLFPACAPSGRKPVYPVHGQVLLEGKPVPGAQVILHPLQDDDRDHPVRPLGQVGADGSFQLTTYDATDGAPEGTYAATVSLLQKPRGAEGDVSQNLLPPRYANPQTSPLRVEIGKGQNELPPFQLTRR
jgi:hypothetical protein